MDNASDPPDAVDDTQNFKLALTIMSIAVLTFLSQTFTGGLSPQCKGVKGFFFFSLIFRSFDNNRSTPQPHVEYVPDMAFHVGICINTEQICHLGLHTFQMFVSE